MRTWTVVFTFDLNLRGEVKIEIKRETIFWGTTQNRIGLPRRLQCSLQLFISLFVVTIVETINATKSGIACECEPNPLCFEKQ